MSNLHTRGPEQMCEIGLGQPLGTSYRPAYNSQQMYFSINIAINIAVDSQPWLKQQQESQQRLKQQQEFVSCQNRMNISFAIQ
jgi:hypothetical protein